MEIFKVIFLAVGLMAFAIAGMAIKILLKKGGKFPNTHVSGNKYLKRNGIYCSQTQDKLEQRKGQKQNQFKKLKFVPNNNAG